MSNDVVVQSAPPLPGELSVVEVLAQVEKIQTLMQKAMKENEHYGKIPGTPKPTLLKAGAEKLCLMFRLDPQYEITETRDGNHLTITSRCTLYHVTSGLRMGSGMGSCSTRESKYAYRKGERTCPTCGNESIIKGKQQFGGGWLCWPKRDGCGAKFSDGDKSIEDQNTDRVENPDIADVYNTVLKMSNKRALVAGVLNVTAASDIFTQDLEDIGEARRSIEPSEDARTITPAEVLTLTDRLQAMAVESEKFLEFFKVQSETELTFGQYKRAMTILDQKEAAAARVASAKGAPNVTALISEAQVKRIFAIAKSDKSLIDDVLSRYGYDHAQDIPKAEYNEICAEIEKMVQA